MPELVTSAFRGAAAAARAAPAPVAGALGARIGRAVARLPGPRRQVVERNLRRVCPELGGVALRRAVRGAFESYGRYWAETFRLPTTSVAEIEAGLSQEGFHRITEALEAGRGAILAVPHLGSWEWAGSWLTRVQGIPVSVVVERVEPPGLFEWFAGLRRQAGFEVIPLGPAAGRAAIRVLRANRVLALLCDRDIGGGGVEVEFFGERTTLPAGPATLALRTGAPIVPTGAYQLPGGRHHGVALPALIAERKGRLGEDVERVTQEVAAALETLIRGAPEQWHMMQPNWPSDRPLSRRC